MMRFVIYIIEFLDRKIVQHSAAYVLVTKYENILEVRAVVLHILLF